MSCLQLCCCSNLEENLEADILQKLTGILPVGYEYRLCSFTLAKNGGFITQLSLPLSTKEASCQWKDAFQQKSMTTYRVNKTYPHVGKKILFKMDYHCQHNKTKGLGKKMTKKMSCSAKLTITIHRTELKQSRNVHLPGYPTMITLRWNHNHVVNAVSALRYRDVGDVVHQRLLELFHEGYTVTSALDVIQSEAMEQKNYLLLIGDRQHVPDYDYAFRLYKKQFEEKYGKYSGPLSADAIFKHTENVGAAHEISLRTYNDEGKLIIALATPLMLRVHELIPQSAEIAFLDASGNMDRYDFQVILMMTHSPLGGLPLGVIVTSSLSTAAIEIGLKMLQELLTTRAFYGRGTLGPTLFMTDHADAEKKAIQSVYPQSKQLLCAFHILQACWRFLWDRKTGVQKEDRPLILNALKSLLYADSEEQLNSRYATALENNAVSKYSVVVHYLYKLWNIRREWAVALRTDLLTRGANTNNIVEAAFRVMKDKILRRKKTFNVVQLIENVSAVLSGYYSRKILSVICQPGSIVGTAASKKAIVKSKDITIDEISQVCDDTFNVCNNGVCYLVNVSIGVCSCAAGSSGAACKHQFAVQMHYGASFISNMPLNNEKERICYLEVATGTRDVPPGWFRPLCDNNLESSNGIIEIPIDSTCPDELGGEKETDSLSRIASEGPSTECVEDYLSQFRDLCKEIEGMVSNDPETLLEPLKKFIERGNYYKGTKTGLATMLATFGKPYQSRGVGKYIKVQPTALTRRRMASKGSQSQTCGRQPLGSCLKRKMSCADGPAILPSRKRIKLPHSLAKCVSNNTSIGKTHETKMT